MAATQPPPAADRVELSREATAIEPPAMDEPLPAPLPPAGDPRAAALVQALDDNDDGALTPEEFRDGAIELLRAARRARQTTGAMVARQRRSRRPTLPRARRRLRDSFAACAACEKP